MGGGPRGRWRSGGQRAPGRQGHLAPTVARVERALAARAHCEPRCRVRTRPRLRERLRDPLRDRLRDRPRHWALAGGAPLDQASRDRPIFSSIISSIIAGAIGRSASRARAIVTVLLAFGRRIPKSRSALANTRSPRPGARARTRFGDALLARDGFLRRSRSARGSCSSGHRAPTTWARMPPT
jgi:hypothetical protein